MVDPSGRFIRGSKGVYLNVLICNDGPWGTGSATVADGVAAELQVEGHRARVIFPDAGFQTPDAERYYGRPGLYHILRFPARLDGFSFYTFPLILTDPHPRNYRGAWTSADLTTTQLEAYIGLWERAIAEVAATLQPDIVECQHIWLTDQAAMRVGLPFISVAHHSDQLGFLRDPRMRKYARRSASAAMAIFAVSERVRAEVLSLYPVAPEKVHIMPNGYDDRIFFPRSVSRQALFDRHGLPLSDLPIITFAGRLSLTKGIDILLAANRLLQRRRPVLLAICGAGDIADVPVKYGDLTNVVFLGHQPPEVLADWHRAATASVMPSRSEGFGISALEAMGCGTPVVGTPTGALDQLAAKLVPTEDPMALARAIRDLAELSALERARLSRQVAERAAPFSWRVLVRRRLALYQSSLASQAA